MKHFPKALFAATAVATICFAAGTASAATDPDAACHAAIGKAITKYQQSIAKNIATCHKLRNAGKIAASTECNDATASDTKSLNSTNAAKALAGVVAKCTLPANAAVLALYTRCPSPGETSDDGGATNGIDSFAELVACQVALTNSYIEFLADAMIGKPQIDVFDPLNPNTPFTMHALSKLGGKCHNGAVKAFSGAVKGIGASFAKCMATAEAGGLQNSTTCQNYATVNIDGKAQKALDAYGNLGLGPKGVCSTDDNDDARLHKLELDSLHTCGATPGKFTLCANQDLKNGMMGIMESVYELPSTCPTSADVIINAGHGIKGGASRLDSGYQGLAHNIDVIDQSKGAVSLSNCDSDCKNCTVKHNSRNGNCRCNASAPDPASNATIKCNLDNAHIEIPDPTCPDPDGGGPATNAVCHCYFGPPLPISAASNPVCVLNRFKADFNGTTGAVGTYNVQTQTNALVHNGTASRPCPKCTGATVGASGVCQGGARNGLPCTTNALTTNFGNTSFDCLPSPGSNTSGSGINLALNFTSGTSALDPAAITGASFCSSGSCHCGVCSLGSKKIGCQDNADCALFSAGTCSTVDASPAQVPKQNACAGSLTDCVNDGNGNGLCNNGPFDNYCDAFIGSNGRGVVNCNNNAECDSNDCNGDGTAAPAECGLCLHPDQRLCFLPTVTATGTPGVLSSEGVSSFCSGTTGNSGLDNAGGLPGPGRVKLNFNFNLTCDDGTTQFLPPSGANCPGH